MADAALHEIRGALAGLTEAVRRLEQGQEALRQQLSKDAPAPAQKCQAKPPDDGVQADVPLPPIPVPILAAMHEDFSQLDPDADRMLAALRSSPAPEIWHKHGNFYHHLKNVWQMLVAWGQPRAICRLGLFHSAYSNSFVSMKIFDPETDRGKLRDLIGAEAEELTYKFCVIDREELERRVLTGGCVPEGGFDFKHIRSGETVHVSRKEAGAFLVHTVADYVEQFHDWQEELERGRVGALWPGNGAPQSRLTVVSRFAEVAKRDGELEVVPPFLANCTATLAEHDEKLAQQKYWQAISGEKSLPVEELQRLLEEASTLNPFVGEPHILLAQIHVQAGRWASARASAASGVRLLCEWGSAWDKRMMFEGWLSWARCIHYQAGRKEWPDTSGGVESLGAIADSQRYRELSVGSNFVRWTEDAEANGAKRRKTTQ